MPPETTTAPTALPPPRRGVLQRMTGLVLAVVLGYASLLGAVYALQERLIFAGTPLPQDYRFDPGQDFDELRIAVPDGELHGLLLRQPRPRGLVFFLHGNAGNAATWTTNAAFYRRANYDLFMLDYRGYGKSRGSQTSEAQLHADVRAAWEQVAPRYAGQPVVIVGRSLGTGLAARLARDVHPALLVLVSPYSSFTAIAEREYPWVPDALLKYPLPTAQWLAQVASPVLLLHGERDTLIPSGESEVLRQAAREAEVQVIAGAGHNDIHQFPAYVEILAARLAAAADGVVQTPRQ